MDSTYKTAMKTWAEHGGPYGWGNVPAIPHKPRSILKDVAYGMAEVYRPVLSGPWGEGLGILLMTSTGFLPAIPAYCFAYWATWEKLATMWRYTTGEHELRTTGSCSPPRWHERAAVLVGLFWGALAMAVWLSAFSTVMLLVK